METPSKLRVVFDRKVLNKHQRLEGLTRSWVLLKPNVKTISEFQSHIQKRFRLNRKCPNGVALYIDGFVLPPFESTCMLHASDIISVRKKDNTQINSIKVGDKPLAITEVGEDSNGQKQKTGKILCMHNENDIHADSQLDSKKKRKHSDEVPSPKKKKLKANSKKLISLEEDGDIIDKVVDYQTRKKSSNRSREDRKLVCSLQRVKQCVRKKDNTLIDSTEVGDKPLAITETGENSNAQKGNTGKVLYMHNENGIHTDFLLDSKQKRKHFETPNPKKKLIANSNKEIAQEEDVDTVDKVVDYQSRKKSSDCSSEDNKLTYSLERVTQYKPAVDSVVGGSTHDHANGSMAKKQNRNARRKKEKRMLIRELKDRNRQNDNQQFGINSKLLKKKEKKQNSEIGEETAPPAPSDWQRQAQEKQASDNWNRPANKNRQNNKSVNQWHQSTAYSDHQYCYRNQKNGNNWSDHTNNGNQYNDRNNLKKCNNANGYNGQEWNWSNRDHIETSNGTTNKWNDVVNNKEQCSGNTSKWDGASSNYEQSVRNEIVPLNEKKGSSPVDFESLFPLTRIPWVGDIIAYRLIEISPTWCPSVTPFRIGEVTSYNYLTLSIVLVPVPEYPIITSDTQQQSSLYKEDGTLQIHYPSLIDVRLFKAFDLFKTSSDSFLSIEREKNPQKENGAPVDKWELALANCSSNVNEITTQPIENGNGRGGSAWDQIKQMINEKRSEIDESKRDRWGEWTSNKSSSSKSSRQNGCSGWNNSRQAPGQAARGRGMAPTRGSFRGGRGRGKYRHSKPCFGKWSA